MTTPAQHASDLEVPQAPEGAAQVTPRPVLDPRDIDRALTRVAHEILERNKGGAGLALVGIRSRGVHLAERIRAAIMEIEPSGGPIPFG
ncbi:MAG: hypothetical protein ACHQE5_03675, partial [Actinomycetes bacterium]